MRIHRIRLRNYRGVDEHEVSFPATGVTVVQGDNEVGKSSLAEALDLLFDYQDSSTNKAVKAVKPVHKDVGAEVEAEIEAGPYRFTYMKRFHREKATVLRVSAPRLENLTGREAHERVQQILAEAVDVPLWRALRLHQGVRPDQADLSEQTSLAAALDNASAGALAGEREANVVELARAEFERYWTPSGKTLKSEVLALVRAEGEADERVDALRRRLADMDDDIEHAASLVTRTAELAEEAEEQRARVQEYDRRWRSVDALLRDVETARAVSEAAEGAHRSAVEELSRRQALIEAVGRAERLHRERVVEHDRHGPALAAAEAAVASAQERLDAAAARGSAAQQALAAAQADFAYARDSLDLEQMSERLARVESADAAVVSLDALLAGNRVDADALEAIEDAHLDVAQARARVEVESPVVEVEALAPVSVLVDGVPGGRALSAGDVARGAVVELPGLARVTVQGGREGGQLAAALAAAEARLAELCAAVGVADAAAAKRAAAARRDALRERESLVTRRQADLRDLTAERLAGKVQRLRERLESERVARPAETAAPLDFDTARRRAEDAEAEATAALELLREADHERSLRRKAFEQLQAKAELSAREMELARRQVSAAREDLESARARTPDGVLAGRVETAGAKAGEAAGALRRASDAADRARPDDLRLALDNASKVLEKLEAERRGAEDMQTQIRTRLALMGEEGLHDRLAEAEADLDHRRRLRRSTERRAAAARRLYDTLMRCRAEARQAYVGPLRMKIESFGKIVFGDDFSVELGDDLRILRRTVRGVTVDFDQLSMGAREQLCVISRLACAAIVAGDGGVPVVLDDSLGWSDNRRLEKLGAVLGVAAKEAQVIVLTCLPERYRHVGSAHVVHLT